MIYYQGWEKDYSDLLDMILKKFKPEEILWVSLGTITYPRGLDKELRNQYQFSKIWQIDQEETPDGKITYAYEVRKKLYTLALQKLSPWKNKVYFYLCMEFQKMWKDIMDVEYKSIPEFNKDMCNHVWSKLKLP